MWCTNFVVTFSSTPSALFPLNSAAFHVPVYGDILYEVCGLCVRDDDAFRGDGQGHFPELLGTGPGLKTQEVEKKLTEQNKPSQRDVLKG